MGRQAFRVSLGGLGTRGECVEGDKEVEEDVDEEDGVGMPRALYVFPAKAHTHGLAILYLLIG